MGNSQVSTHNIASREHLASDVKEVLVDALNLDVLKVDRDGRRLNADGANGVHIVLSERLGSGIGVVKILIKGHLAGEGACTTGVGGTQLGVKR
mmetsp:Transcript_36446/g.53291  ORF Transcript_36446/g.53291 Transcript_36446/m.53291 type:complete len:94 (-) Transcript_36446:1107-1388(-)